MLPFVIAGAPPGLEIVHPMAMVVLGGLVTSTLLSLFVLPALYLRFGGVGRALLARGGADAAEKRVRAPRRRRRSEHESGSVPAERGLAPGRPRHWSLPPSRSRAAPRWRPESATGYEPSKLESIEGAGGSQRVTFTAEGARRIGLRTAAVRRDGKRQVVPYAAS